MPDLKVFSSPTPTVDRMPAPSNESTSSDKSVPPLQTKG